jgi:uncharacterized membrane protein (UPF0136 family)
MLFNRSGRKIDAVICSFVAVALAIFSMVITIVFYVQGNENPSLLSGLLLSSLVIVISLLMAIGFLSNHRNLAVISAAVGLPFYASAVFFENIDTYMIIGDIYNNSFVLWLGIIWYMTAAVGLGESFVYLVMHFVTGKANPKFSVPMNVEVNAFLLAGAAVCFGIYAGSLSWGFWAFFAGCCSEIGMVEAMADSLDMGLEKDEVSEAALKQ